MDVEDCEEWGSADYSELISRLPKDDPLVGSDSLELRIAKELFRKYDKNESGSIDSTELRALLADMFDAAKVNPDRRQHVLASYIKYLSTHGYNGAGMREIRWDEFSVLFDQEDFAFVLPVDVNGPSPPSAVAPAAPLDVAAGTAPQPTPTVDYRALPSRIPRLRKELRHAAPVVEVDLAESAGPVVKLVPSDPIPGSRLQSPSRVKRQWSLASDVDAMVPAKRAATLPEPGPWEPELPDLGDLTLDCGSSAEILFSPCGRYAGLTAHDKFVDVFELGSRRRVSQPNH
eukprot:TRINITY_DN2322_c0_g1_i2.p1 TRINITY_DN2322_c0_g1~~TRINITY_DN2322_c0_g1_i2.p1  ORF type:complete len:288 (+),score=44.67 TRINITY_DN2322_c0_g1_i2:84-947(+)